MHDTRIDPVNEQLIVMSEKVNISGLIQMALKGNSLCSSCHMPRTQAAIDWLLRARPSICEDCRELASSLVESEWGDLLRRTVLNTLKGAITFGTRRPFVAGAPRLLTWEFTSRCNTGRCAHCYNDSRLVARGDELTTREALAAVDDFVKAGVLGIAFTGGEALLREDFFAVATYAKVKGLACYLATNGSLLTEERIRQLLAAGVCMVHVSLDSADATAHDRFRGTPGLHRMAVEGIKSSVKAGLQVCIAATATRMNWTGIPELVDLGESLGADWLLVYDFIPTGRGTRFLELTPDMREELFRRMSTLNSAARRIRVSAFSPFLGIAGLKAGQDTLLSTHYLEPSLASSCQSLVKASAGCLAGKYFMAMESNGDYKPCTFLPVNIGNAREESVDHVWKQSPVLSRLRDPGSIRSSCPSCDYNQGCGGGCRARTYAHTGLYIVPDPGCAEISRLAERKFDNAAHLSATA